MASAFAAVYARVNAVRALVSAHRGVLVFLQPLPEAVEFGCVLWCSPGLPAL